MCEDPIGWYQVTGGGSNAQSVLLNNSTQRFPALKRSHTSSQVRFALIVVLCNLEGILKGRHSKSTVCVGCHCQALRTSVCNVLGLVVLGKLAAVVFWCAFQSFSQANAESSLQRRKLFIPVSISLFSLSVSVSLPLSVSVSVSLCLCHSRSVSVCLSVCLPPPFSLSATPLSLSLVLNFNSHYTTDT